MSTEAAGLGGSGIAEMTDRYQSQTKTDHTEGAQARLSPVA